MGRQTKLSPAQRPFFKLSPMLRKSQVRDLSVRRMISRISGLRLLVVITAILQVGRRLDSGQRNDPPRG